MGLFGGSEGGLMDIIRCDEEDYLVHKWRPSGEANSTHKENAIRYGSRLRLRAGEIALFIYQQQNGLMQDVIIGPHDELIQSHNFPILSSVVDSFFGGDSPFMAEVYFINMASHVQMKFGVPFFDMFDSRFPDLAVPCAVRGSIMIHIEDHNEFIKINKLTDFTLDDFKNKIRDFFIRKAKAVILNIIDEHRISVMQVERKIDEINEILDQKMNESMRSNFGVVLKRLDISSIELNKEHPNYLQLKAATADQQSKFIDAQTNINITNLSENMRIQRDDAEMQSQGRNFSVYQLDQQADILGKAAQNLGSMGDVGNGNMNIAGMMTGMQLGGVIGGQMGDAFYQMNQMQAPPPPSELYHIALNGVSSGPYNMQQLMLLVQNMQFGPNHHIWKQGMANWELASTRPELSGLFKLVPPPPPIPSALATPPNIEIASEPEPKPYRIDLRKK